MASDIPVISISLDESLPDPDEDSKGLCIDDAKTDVEDLDSDSEIKKSNGLIITGIKKSRGSITDVENFSTDTEKENYETADYDAKITLDEFLDQGTVDEAAAFFGTKKKNLPKMKSNPKEPKRNSLIVNAENIAAALTDCEDMQDSGPEEEEPEINYEYDEKPIILENGGSVDIHDANKKRSSTYIPKLKTPSSDSSDDEPVNTKVRHPPRHHHHHKIPHPIKIQDAKSDIENMLFSDDEQQSRKASVASMIEVNEADEVTFEASDVEDLDPEISGISMSKSMTFPEINITFAQESPTKVKKTETKLGSTLGIPVSKDDGATDVEDLDSSDSDEEGATAYPKCKLWKQLIPKAVIKDHRDTDEEDMGQISDAEDLLDPRLKDEDIDVVLPSPIRELKIVKDDENGQPQVQVLPLTDNLLLGIDNYADGGVTDCEDCSDENDDVENYDETKYAIEKIPDYTDGGSIESAEKSIDKNQPSSRPVSSTSFNNLSVQINDNPVTDTEELPGDMSESFSNPGGTCELRRRRGKGKSGSSNSSKNSGFLIISNEQDAGLTDVEEIDFDDDEKKGKFDSKRRPTIEIATILNSNDTMTDEECFSGEECLSTCKSPDSRPLSALNQDNYCSSVSTMDCLDVDAAKRNRRKNPIIRKISPSPDTMGNPVTDTEDFNCVSDIDEPYSRAQTVTPMEVHRAIQDTLENSEIQESHTGAFDSRRERKNMKDPRENDALTDVSDIELPVANVQIEANNLVDSVLEESVNIISGQLNDSKISLPISSGKINENGTLNIEPPVGINVIVKSPTLESLTSKSFEEYVNNLEVEKEQKKEIPPKPKRRFVFTDSLEEKESKHDKKPPSARVDRKFERLSSDIEDLEKKENEFDATFGDLKDDVSALQSDFSKLSWGDDSNSQGTTGDELASNTPDDVIQEPEINPTEPVQTLVHTESIENAHQVPRPTPRLSKSYTNETNNSSITQDDLPSARLDSHTSFEHETSSQASSTTEQTSDSFNQRKEFWDTLDSNAKKQLSQEIPPVPKPRQGVLGKEESKSVSTDSSSIRDVPDFKPDSKQDSFNVDDRLEDESFPISEVSESVKSHDLKKDVIDKHDKDDSISVSLKGEFVERYEGDTEGDESEHVENVAPTKLVSKDTIESLDEDDSPAAFYIGDKSDNIITRSQTQKRDGYAFDNDGYEASMDDSSMDDAVMKTDFIHQGIEIYDDLTINEKDDKNLTKHLVQPNIDEEKLEEEAIEEEIALEHLKNIDKSEIETSEKKDVPSALELETLEPQKDKQWKPIVHSPIEKVIELEKPVEFSQEVNTAKATAIEVIKDLQGAHSKPQVSFENFTEISKDLRTQEEAVDQAFEEIKDSLDAVQEELIEVVKDGKLIKQSPSEFEISLIPHQQILESHPEEQVLIQDTNFDKQPSLIKVQAPSESEDSSLRQDSSADESLNKLEIIRRKEKKSTSSSNRWSTTDPETGSDEQSSYYQSVEQYTDRSRPQSSDFSNLIVTTGSEYETAHSQSTIPASGSTDYHSAMSTLQTPSMKSFDSESSGNLGSIEASEASETLVPSQMEECEADILPGQDEEDLIHDDSDKSGSLEEKQPGILLEPENISSSHLKRSHEMIFCEETKSSSVERLDELKRIEDQQKLASSIEDVKFGSLEDGSLLSVSLSSASNIETVMENMPEGSDIVDSLIGSYDSGKVYLSRSTDEAATTPVDLKEHERIESLTMISSVIQDQDPTVTDVNTQISTTIVSSTVTQEYQEGETTEQEKMKRKGHRRNDSTSVHPIGVFKTAETEETQPSSFDSSELDDEMIVHEEEPKPSIPSVGISGGDREESSDSDYDRYESEYARSFRIPTTQVRKKEKREKLEETLPELDIKRSRSPSFSTIETIVEDVHAEQEEHPQIDRRVSPNVQNIPDIQVTDDMVASSEDEFPVEKFRQEIEARTATSPIQYAQQVEYKMTDEQYHEIIDKKYKAQEIERYGGYDSEEDKPPSPGSDSFEMLEQPDISDEFVIVEEVAKEAQEFDTEGKGMGIKKVKREKKHDEDVERLIVKSAPASTDASQLYAHHEDVPFDFEESPPIDQDHESTGVSTRDIGNGYPLEGSKRWVEMQLNDPGNLRYPYDLQGGILEDIKEEDTDFEVGSSRISSFKDSFSSTPDYDSIARKLHARENDNISMSSLQEFESLEHVISLENKKQQQSSQESLSNGSSGGKPKIIRIHGDDISMSSLKEFEALENASLEAVLLEIKAKEEAALLLSRSDESNRSDSSNEKKANGSGKVVTTTVTTTTTVHQQSGEPQKTTTVKVTKTESSHQKAQPHDDDDSLNVMEVSTDSLEGSSKPSKSLYDKESGQHASTDSLEKNNTNADIMSSSIDSIEVNKAGGTTTKSTSRSDSIEQALNDVKKSESIDSIELQQAIARQRIDRDSLEEPHGYELHTTTTTTSGGRQIITHTLTETTSHVFTTPYEMQKEFSSDSINSATSTQEPLLTSTESIETGSTATNATFTNDGNSQMSGSMTSCDSTTLIDNTDIRVSSSLMFEELGGHFVHSPYDLTGRQNK
uniref:CSON013775 protein n=1 Tax=Culicoides sonorensis TaxID=179676 RepID=A0A336M8Q0_CULSO